MISGTCILSIEDKSLVNKSYVCVYHLGFTRDFEILSHNGDPSMFPTHPM